MGRDVFFAGRFERVRVAPVAVVAGQGSIGPMLGEEGLPGHAVIHGEKKSPGDFSGERAKKRAVGKADLGREAFRAGGKCRHDFGEFPRGRHFPPGEAMLSIFHMQFGPSVPGRADEVHGERIEELIRIVDPAQWRESRSVIGPRDIAAGQLCGLRGLENGRGLDDE